MPNRKALILFDLDGVLVQKNFKTSRLPAGVDTAIFARERLPNPKHAVYIRPNLARFFARIAELAKAQRIELTLGVWSSMMPDNVTRIVELLETKYIPDVYFRYVMSRQDCFPAPTPDNIHATIKPIPRRFAHTTLPWSLHEIFLVDNEAGTFAGNDPAQCFLFPEFDLCQLVAAKTPATGDSWADMSQQALAAIDDTAMIMRAADELMAHVNQTLNKR